MSESYTSNTLVWRGTVAIAPPPTTATIPVIIGGNPNMTDSAFRSVAPKQDNLDVVKITKENFVAVAKSLVRKNGPSVRVFSDYFTYGTDDVGQAFHVGDFVVRDYDYKRDLEFIRLATLEERKKYGLR